MSLSYSDTLVSFGGNAVKIISDHPVIAEILQIHFRHCNTQPAETINTFHITSTSVKEFTVMVDGNEVFSNVGYEQALWLVMNEVITRLNAKCTRGLIFHAAALANANNAVTLCGQSGSGKSSLAAWLTSDGFQYLTDEVIEVSLDGSQVNGLARSIALKPDSGFIWQRRLPDTKSQGILLFEDGSAWVAPQLFHPDAVISTARPRVIVFPSYLPDAPLQTKKMTEAETLFRLMKTLVNARNLPGHGMEATTRLAQQVKAYSLRYSDIEEATDWIKRTLPA